MKKWYFIDKETTKCKINYYLLAHIFWVHYYDIGHCLIVIYPIAFSETWVFSAKNQTHRESLMSFCAAENNLR